MKGAPLRWDSFTRVPTTGRLISERPPSLSLIRCFIKREQKDSGGVIELRSLADIVYYAGAPKGGLRRQMIIKKSESTKYPNSSKCTTYEYAHGDKDINISLAILDGRYPDEGRVMNTVCKEIVYIVGGKGKMEIDGRGFSVAPGRFYLHQTRPEVLLRR